MIVTDGDKFTFGYDNLKRLSSKTLINEQSGGTSLLKVDYGYHTEGNSTTTQIETMRFTKPDNASVARIPQLTYSYDAAGNITKVLSGSTTLAEYAYDSRGQLLSEDDGKYYTTYTYDTYGNIRSAWVRASEDHSFVYGVYNYTYNDNGLWKDQLKGYSYQNYYGDISSFSGNLTYDVLGNPLTYFNGNKTWNFTWQYGKQLASATDGTHTITNEYDVDGVRESKTVDGIKHEYITLDGKIIRETYGNTTVDYFYDNEGKPYKLQISEGNGTYTGYYVLNQQGDVIAILNANGVKVVSYEYNAWGKVVDEASYDSITGPLFLEHNALKYRGYYYDADLGLYYLGSRFYDQNICRFVNADDSSNLAGNNEFISFNLYSYCLNNPVNRIDEDGNLSVLNCAKVAIGAVAFAGAIALTVATGGSAATIAIGVAKIASSVALSTVASGYAGYRSNGKQGMIDGLCNGFMFGSLSACAGAVSKSIDIAKATSGTPNSMGQAGERLAHINPKAKKVININGRNRIPDKLTSRTLTEVKNVKYISNTRQLKDFADYADIYKLKKILYVRPDTKISSSLIRAGWKVKYLW